MSAQATRQNKIEIVFLSLKVYTFFMAKLPRLSKPSQPNDGEPASLAVIQPRRLTKSLQSKRIFAAEIIRLLKKYYPQTECALHHKNVFELLVATILSAQCTDVRVNQITPALFSKFPRPKSFADAQVEEIEELIRSAGFYKNKAKNIKAAAQAIVANHGGKVPNSLEELTKLAGVGRKTANVVLGVGFKIPSGIVVDTHVTRLSNRFGFVKTENAVIIERELGEIIDKKEWIDFSHRLIDHGRKICKARKPRCEVCFLSDICPSSATG